MKRKLLLVCFIFCITLPLFSNGEKEESSNGIVTLNFLGFKQGSEIGALPEIISNFEQENPTIKINYEGINTANGYTTVMNTRLASGNDLDIFMIYGSMPDLISGGYLEDLSNESYSSRLSDSLKPFLSKDDKLYACYSNSAALPALFSNNEILEKCDISIPTTWNEFLEACSILKEKGYTPMVIGNKTGWTGLVISYGMTNSTLANKGELISAEKKLINGDIEAGDLFLDSFVELEKLYKNEFFDTKKAVGMQWNEETFASFANGEAAFMVGGSWQVSQLKSIENNDLEFTVSVLPGQLYGDLNATLLPAVPIGINSNSKYVKEAKQFLDYFFNAENCKKWSESQSAMSPLSGVSVVLDDEMQPFIDVVSTGNTTPYELQTIADNEMQNTIKSMAQAVLLGDLTPKEASEEITAFFVRQQMLN